jgi:putative hydrolase of the HAD superfamily
MMRKVQIFPRYTSLMPLAGLLFDLGATLLYQPAGQSWARTLDHMRAGLLASLSAAGYDLDPGEFTARFAARLRDFDEQRLTDWIEYTAAYTLRATLADLGAPPPAPQVTAAALAAYFRASESQWKPVPGLHPTLLALSAAGYRLALITNNPDADSVRRLLAAAGLARYFDPLVISAEVGVRKPNPAIFRRVLEAWGLPPQQCVMIGDNLGADILGAQLTGLRHVWVTQYADHPANRAHRSNILPEAEIVSLASLPALLAQWRDSPPSRDDTKEHEIDAP